jgi:hypothetical protein
VTYKRQWPKQIVVWSTGWGVGGWGVGTVERDDERLYILAPTKRRKPAAKKQKKVVK